MKTENKNYRERLQEIYADAKKETIRLLLDNGLTELSLPKDCDAAYATFYAMFCDGNSHCPEHIVTKVKIIESNGEFDVAFNIEGSDEWCFYYEVRDEIAVDIYEVVWQMLNLY